jgi:hypothetical protein
MTWKNNEGDGLGDDPYLLFKLPSPKYVYCVRLKFVLTNPADTPALFQAWWANSVRPLAAPECCNSTYRLRTWAGEQTLTVWINQPIDHFRIDPDTKPCHFRLTEMVAMARSSEVSKTQLSNSRR